MDGAPNVNSANLMDIEDCATYLGTTVRHMRSLVYRSEVPYCKVGGKLRFRPEDIEAFVESTFHPADFMADEAPKLDRRPA